jgi:hypothetical protein
MADKRKTQELRASKFPANPTAPSSTPKDREHWAVRVYLNGESILTIETAMLAGKPDLTPEDEACIEMCGRQLLAFIGCREPSDDRLERLREIREAHCRSARRVPTDPELAAYRYGKAEGISEVLRLIGRISTERDEASGVTG